MYYCHLSKMQKKKFITRLQKTGSQKIGYGIIVKKKRFFEARELILYVQCQARNTIPLVQLGEILVAPILVNVALAGVNQVGLIVAIVLILGIYLYASLMH
jgi:hypothetical protein